MTLGIALVIDRYRHASIFWIQKSDTLGEDESLSCRIRIAVVDLAVEFEPLCGLVGRKDPCAPDVTVIAPSLVEFASEKQIFPRLILEPSADADESGR